MFPRKIGVKSVSFWRVVLETACSFVSLIRHFLLQNLPVQCCIQILLYAVRVWRCRRNLWASSVLSGRAIDEVFVARWAVEWCMSAVFFEVLLQCLVLVFYLPLANLRTMPSVLWVGWRCSVSVILWNFQAEVLLLFSAATGLLRLPMGLFSSTFPCGLIGSASWAIPDSMTVCFQC